MLYRSIEKIASIILNVILHLQTILWFKAKSFFKFYSLPLRSLAYLSTASSYNSIVFLKTSTIAQSTLIPSADIEIKIRYDRHGNEHVCIFYEHLTTLACHSVEMFSDIVKVSVPHLLGMPLLGISSLDKDNVWVDLTNLSFPKFVKCVKCDLGNDTSLQIKVADGSTIRLCPGFFNSYMPGTKRSLDTDFTGVYAKQISVYQSPVKLDICLKEQELRGNSSITIITLDTCH